MAYTHVRAAQPALSAREVKGVAEVLNYKIVYGYLGLNNFAEAVDQQLKHIAAFRAPPAEQPWLHYAWLSRQYVCLSVCLVVCMCD